MSTTCPGYTANKEHPAATIEYDAWMSSEPVWMHRRTEKLHHIMW